MKFIWGIRKKLLVMTALTMLPLLVGAVWITGRLVEKSHARQALLLEKATIDHVTSRLNYLARMANSDVLSLASLPSMEALAENSRPEGLAVGGVAYSKNYQATLLALIGFMDSKQVYDQARLLGADGRELLRVNLVDGRARGVPLPQLQAKGSRYYFANAARLPAGKVYVSFVDLNREHGVIEKPHKPMLRFATPLRDDKGRLLGVVVLNFYAARLIRESMAGVKELRHGDWMILDQDGYYLYNSRHPELLWGSPRDLNTGNRCQKDFGQACRAILDGETTSMRLDDASWRAYSGIVNFPQNPEKRLAVVHLTTPPSLMTYLSQFGWLMLSTAFLALVLALLLAWLSGWMVVSPLTRLTGTVKRFSQDDMSARSELSGNDEVGRLATGFNEMAERLQTLYSSLESQVAQRTADLRETNRRLGQSEARLRAILDSTVDAIITIDEHGVVQSFNRGAENLFGYTAEEVIGHKVNMLQPPEVAQRHDEYLRRYLETGRARIIGKGRNERGRRKDGSIFPMYLAVSEVRMEEGRFFTGIVRDTTELRATEDSLRESQQMYKSLAEASPMGIFYTDTQGKCTYVNDQYCQIAGIKPEEALGEGWLRALHPGDAPAIKESWRRTIEWENSFEGEYRFRHPDGKVVWFYGRAVPRKDSEDRLLGYVGTVMDISDRKEMESDLTTTMKLFQATFDQAAVGIAHVSPDGGWLRVNNKLCQVVGYSREELLDKTFQQITHPEDLESDLEFLNKVLAGELDNYSMEKRYIKKDMSITWINLTVSLVRDPKGEPMYFISVVEDINERKVAERSRAESERRFRTLVANVPGAVYRCENDADWTMRFISDPIKDITGYPAEDFIDNKRRSYVDVIHPSDREIVAKHIQDSLSESASFELEYRIVRRDGEVRWVYEKGQALPGEDGDLWLDGAVLDITERKKTEQDSVRLGRVLEGSLNEIYIFDGNSMKFLQVNQGARQNLGYSMLELSEMTPLDIKPELTREEFDELIAPLRRGEEQSLEFSTVHQRKDGTTYPVEVNLQYSSQDNAQVFVAIIQDVTEKYRTLGEISRLSLVAQRTDNAVMITDPEGRIQWVNDAFTRISEYTLEEALGRVPGELLQGPETDQATVRQMGQKLAQGEGFNVEVINYTKSGRKHWLALDVQPVRDEGGEITTYVSVGSDITERKLHEQELRQQAQIIDQTHDAVVSLDLEGKVASWNRGARELFGYAKDEVMGQSIALISLPRDASQLNERLFAPLLAKGQQELEMGLVKKDGQEFTALLSLSVLRNLQGEPAGFVLYAVDISQRKKAEEAVRKAKETAEAASRIKSEFLANMSHELRTPLNAIIGFSEILLDQTFGGLNQKQSRQTQHILDSGRHLLSLINDILDLSKVESGKMELDLTVVNLASLLESSLVLIKEKTTKHGIALKLEMPEEVRELNFPADERKVKQIMFNLLSNAAKFTPDGGGITITAGQEGGLIRVSVRDTGVGIAPEDQKRIFEEFEQVDSSYARQQQGTGLGLSLTRKLVELHGGTLEVESEGKDKGSTFTFTLPLKSARAEEQPQAPVEPEMPQAAEGINGDKPLVLVVDDDPMARELLSGYLQEGGYAVATAGTGAQGLELAQSLHPTVITLDIMLPDISGFEVLRQLKESPATAVVPVIIVSITDDREKGLNLGATDFLEKPVRKEELLHSMSDLVSCAPGSFHKVLVVDDNPSDVEMLKSVLLSRGCEVLSAPGGAEGVEAALRERPDLIILDLQMPDVSGWDVLESLRQKGGDWRPPILVFTGADLSAQQRQQLAGRVQAVVLKGGGKQELLREINRLTQMTYNRS